MELYFVRHGETQWNSEDRCQGGESDIPLNENGQEQATKTGKYLSRHFQGFDHVYCSPLSRCLETCHLVQKEMRSQAHVNINENLREKLCGKGAGLLYKEKAHLVKSQKSYTKFIKNIPVSDRPQFRDLYEEALYKEIGAETTKSSTSRCKEFLSLIKTLADDKPARILIVSHGALMTDMLKVITNDTVRCKIHNCSIIKITYIDDLVQVTQFDEHLIE